MGRAHLILHSYCTDIQSLINECTNKRFFQAYCAYGIPGPLAVEQIHLPRSSASECAGMRVGVEGAAKSLHLPRLYALQVTSAGVSVEGDFI